MLARGNQGVSRRTLVSIALLLAAASCREVASREASVSGSGPGLQLRRSPSPFTEVTAGSVSALIPDRWEAVPVVDPSQEGFLASPRPSAWGRMDGSAEGITAVWVDATRVGVPSDYYYLAANGPALGGLMGSARCRSLHERVIVDHRPGFLSGRRSSPGDFVARGSGICRLHGTWMRWEYFVAAPGYGPLRRVGIPSSGLYVIVALLDLRREPRGVLNRLIGAARFPAPGVTAFVPPARS